MTKLFNSKFIKNFNCVNSGGNECFDFIKIKKKSFLITTISFICLLVLFISMFVLNTNSNITSIYNFLEKSKVELYVPVNNELDGFNLNKIRKKANKIFKLHKCFVQNVTDNELSPAKDILKNGTKKLIKIASNTDVVLSNVDKQNCLIQLKQNCPEIIKINDSEFENVNNSEEFQNQINNLKQKFENGELNVDDLITVSYVYDSTLSSTFWWKIFIFIIIMFVLVSIILAIKFRNLGAFQIALVSMLNLIMGIGSSFFVIYLFTQKINLVFTLAIAIFFTTNLTYLFNEINNLIDTPENSNEKLSKIANVAINKTMPLVSFLTIITTLALLLSIVVGLVFDNYLMLYLTISIAISLFVNQCLNIFFNAQLWLTLIKNKTIKPIKIKPTKIKMS